MNIKKAVTHSGDFHCDDIFGSALLSMIFPGIEIIRTREKEIIDSADLVFDVGGIYDPKKMRFDHHQSGGAGERQNGIPFASFGLLWKEFGTKACCGNQSVALSVENRLVNPIDAIDNGIDICLPKIPSVLPYSIQQMFSVFTPTWEEDENRDVIFKKLSAFALEILKREIEVACAFERAKEKVKKIYDKTEDKRILILDAQYPISLFQEFTDTLFVVYKGTLPNDFRVKAIRKSADCFDVRKPFPENWAGKEGVDLQNITGVKSAKFAHHKRFLVGANDLEGAIELAKLALNA